MPVFTGKDDSRFHQCENSPLHVKNVYAFKSEVDELKTWQNMFNVLCTMRMAASAKEYKFLTYLVEMAALETQSIITDVNAARREQMHSSR